MANNAHTDFRTAIQKTRDDFLSSPLDVVIENLENAADKARAAGDERADKLFNLAEQLRPGMQALDAAEKSFWELFGQNDDDMSPEDSVQP